MADDFNWNDDEVVVVPRQDAVAVYLNSAQNIVIRRERGLYEEEDPFVVIDRKFARDVAATILRLLDETEMKAAE